MYQSLRQTTVAARATGRLFSTSSKRQFDPKKILPAGLHQVRILNNTARDAQQSNLSAEMADVHRQEIGKLIDDCYKDTKGPVGYEQIWGGTVPMMDIWKRGVQPFEELAEMTARMPNTPASMLVRSNSLTSMSLQPKDVVEEFIRLSCQAGMNVFTNFDAHNDPRNHKNVAEAVNKYGGHYQAAISWAVFHKDPTVFNVEWAIQFFKEVAAMGAHSLYVKDPSGVLTPEMAGILASEIKSHFPHLPLVFHTHYQTGYAYMTYLEAVKNGANGIECSLGFTDGAGQPSGLTMLRVLEEYGYDTGNPNRKAWDKVGRYCKSIQHLYPSANVVRTPNIDVEKTGIAGGQRSILDKELSDAGQPHLIPLVDELVQQVREEGGVVCQVTPAADSYAREAIRRLRKMPNFTPGYAQILTGENGMVKEPVDAAQLKQALDDRLLAKARAYHSAKQLSDAALARLTVPQGGLSEIRTMMDTLAAPVRARLRLKEVHDRIQQLHAINAKPHLSKSLNIRINLAQTFDKRINRVVTNIQDRLEVLKCEENELTNTLAKIDSVASDAFYESLLFQRATEAEYDALLTAHLPGVSTLLQEQVLSRATIKYLIAHGGYVSCSPCDLLPLGLTSARQEVQKLDEQLVLGLTETPLKFEQSTVLQGCFGVAAIPNLLKNFFINYVENPAYWPPTYKVTQEEKKVVKQEPDFLYRACHREVIRIVGSSMISELKAIHEELTHYTNRLKKLKDPKSNSFGRLQPATLDKLQERINTIQKSYDGKFKEATDKLSHYVDQHPGKFARSYPQLLDAAAGTFHMSKAHSKKEVEVKMAAQWLSQVVIHHN